MIALPTIPLDPNIRALAGFTRERFTGLTTTAVTLAHEAMSVPAGSTGTGLELVTKNGLALDPAGGAGGYAISGKTITLGTAAIAGDVFLVYYWTRAGTP
jgi:hypothetical protein